MEENERLKILSGWEIIIRLGGILPWFYDF